MSFNAPNIANNLKEANNIIVKTENLVISEISKLNSKEKDFEKQIKTKISKIKKLNKKSNHKEEESSDEKDSKISDDFKIEDDAKEHGEESLVNENTEIENGDENGFENEEDEENAHQNEDEENKNEDEENHNEDEENHNEDEENQNEENNSHKSSRMISSHQECIENTHCEQEEIQEVEFKEDFDDFPEEQHQELIEE